MEDYSLSLLFYVLLKRETRTESGRVFIDLYNAECVTRSIYNPDYFVVVYFQERKFLKCESVTVSIHGTSIYIDPYVLLSLPNDKISVVSLSWYTHLLSSLTPTPKRSIEV